jgi:4-hydroxy-2-oxoheptanedioate aldolase
MSTLITAWSEGATTLGSWTALNTPVVAESLALVGHDYVCLDQQHGIVNDDSLIASLIAVAAGGAAPLVRVAANETSLISKALDSGAEGVIIPLVNDGLDAERAVRSCRYPPRGDRSIGPIRTAGSGRTRTFAEGACIVMAESVSAVDNIDDICSVPGVDAVYVGRPTSRPVWGAGQRWASYPVRTPTRSPRSSTPARGTTWSPVSTAAPPSR